MKGDWLQKLDTTGRTPLDRAMGSGHRAVAEILLRQEREDQQQILQKAPPIHRAAYLGLTEAIRILVNYGVDPATKDELHETPLHKAVRLGYLETAEALLEHCDVNAVNAYGMTPLHWACITGNRDVAHLLIEHGADPNMRNDHLDGLTAFDMAEMMGYKELSSTMKVKSGV